MKKEILYLITIFSIVSFTHCSKEEETAGPKKQTLGHSSVVYESLDERVNSARKLDFVNETFGFLMHNDQVFKTKDQGESWNPFFPNSGNLENIMIVDFFTEQKGIVGGRIDQNAFILLTIDGGLSWDTIYKTPWNVTTLSDVVWTNSTGLVLIAGQFFLKSENSGLTWDTTLTYPNSLDGYFLVDFADEIHGFAVTDGYSYSSNNGGSDWNLLTTFAFPIPIGLDFINGNRGIVTAEKARLTQDGGKTWSTPVVNDTSVVSSLDWTNFVNTEIVYSLAGANNNFGIAKSIDGGNTFDLIQDKWQVGNKYYQFRSSIYMIDEHIGFVFALEKESTDDLETITSQQEVLLKTTTGWE